MRSLPSTSDVPRRERERPHYDPHGGSPDVGRVRPKMTRVQIEALVSGDFAPMYLGPELVHRLNRAWSGEGQRVHMLHVEVVHTPGQCPRCGDRALYRKERRGFLQLKVYPLLGLFPWHCISCRKRTLLRQRSEDQETGLHHSEKQNVRKAA